MVINASNLVSFGYGSYTDETARLARSSILMDVDSETVVLICEHAFDINFKQAHGYYTADFGSLKISQSQAFGPPLHQII